MSRNFVVEWNYFWLKSNNYFCWMKLLLVEVEQIFFWNKIIFGWSWIMIFVEWNYFWLKLNKYFCWMKINWVEVEQILLLNMNVQVVEFCNIWLSIVERHSYRNWKRAENGFVRLSRPRITLRSSKLKARKWICSFVSSSGKSSLSRACWQKILKLSVITCA